MGAETTPYDPVIAEKLGADCEKLRLVYWLYNNDDNGCGPVQGIPLTFFGEWTMDEFNCDGRNVLLEPVPISYSNWNDNFNQWTGVLNGGITNHQWDWINAGKPCHRVMATITCDDTVYGDFKLTAVNLSPGASYNGTQFVVQPGVIVGPELELLVCRTKEKDGSITKAFFDKSGDPIASLTDYYAAEASHVIEPTTGAVPFTAANIKKFYSEDDLCDCLKSCDHAYNAINDTASCVIDSKEGGCIYVRDEQGVAQLVESGVSSTVLWSQQGQLKSRSMVVGQFNEDPSDNDYIVQDELPEGWYFDPTCTGAVPVDPAFDAVDCPVIGVRTICVLMAAGLSLEKKTAYSVSDFDSGDLNVGDPASCTFEITVDDPSPTFVITPIAGYTFTETSPGQFKADFAWSGSSNPQTPLEALITLSTGQQHVLTGPDFQLCSGGGNTESLLYSGDDEKKYVKELCYEGKASKYQDSDGNSLNYDELILCEADSVIQWNQATGYICDQDDERFGDLFCWDFGYSETGAKVYPDGADSPVYLDSKTEEALTPQPTLVSKANPLSAPESTYKCYTSTVTELQTTASDESGTLVWDDSAQGTDLDNAFAFTVSDVGGLSGLNMDFSLDESDGLGSLFTTGSSNGSTNSDNGGAYQFRAGFEGQTDQDSRLRHVMEFSEPVIVDSFFVGDIDRGGDQTQTDITRWQDAARVYGIDSLGNEVEFEQIPGADLVVHSNGFTYMPQNSVEQAGDEDAGNWLTVNSQGVAVVSMIVEYFPGTDAGWNSDESADANYTIPNSSSRMQLHNLEVTRATEESIEVESTRSACATLDTDGSEVWRDAITVVKLTEEELATLVDCNENYPTTTTTETPIVEKSFE